MVYKTYETLVPHLPLHTAHPFLHATPPTLAFFPPQESTLCKVFFSNTLCLVVILCIGLNAIWYIFFFFKHLYWSIIALQWCVSFCFITKWISYTWELICSCLSTPHKNTLVEENLGDIARSVPDRCTKVNTTIESHKFFNFPVHIKVILQCTIVY